MLLRRFLRVKVLQIAYSYTVHMNSNIKKEMDENLVKHSEKELINSIEDTGNLARFIILLLKEIILVAKRFSEKERKKFFPDLENIEIIRRFNASVSGLAFPDNMQSNLPVQKELAAALLHDFISRPDSTGISGRNNSIQKKIQNEHPDRKFPVDFAKWVISHPLLEQYIEEKNIFWIDGLHIIFPLIISFVKNCAEKRAPGELSVLKDTVADKQFAISLLGFYIRHELEFEEIIREKASNWDINRIVMMDKIIMKLAMCELKYTKGMPAKVVLNEYIELAKFFSTPDSSSFINGMLDKIFTAGY